MQCCLKGRRSQTFNVDFRPCPLCAEISPNSLNILIFKISRNCALINVVFTLLRVFFVNVLHQIQNENIKYLAFAQYSIECRSESFASHWILFSFTFRVATVLELGLLEYQCYCNNQGCNSKGIPEPFDTGGLIQYTLLNNCCQNSISVYIYRIESCIPTSFS